MGGQKRDISDGKREEVRSSAHPVALFRGKGRCAKKKRGSYLNTTKSSRNGAGV